MALVTPAAADLARKLGITLTGAVDPRARTTGKPARESAPGDAARAAVAATPAVPSVAATVPAPLRVSIGADHGGVALKATLATHLREAGHSVDDRGTMTTDAVDYPDVAVRIADDVATGRADVGIMIDGAGIGSCMAANKVPGVRAALCYDISSARNAREHNHANVLTLGAGLIGPRLAVEIAQAFLTTPFGPGRHAARVAKIDALDRRPTTSST